MAATPDGQQGRPAEGPASELPLSFRAGAVLAFVAVLVFPLAMFSGQHDHGVLLVPAAIVTVLVLVSGRWLMTSERVPWLRPVPAFAYLVVVVLLRQAGGGASSGYSPLLLLPLVWVALFGVRADLVVLTLGIVVTLAGPIVVVGAPDYPVGEWRRTAIWLLVAPTMGATIQNLVQRERDANVALNSLARTDPLTGLMNRRAYVEHATRELTRARRTGSSLALVVFDLDKFKSYNDEHGHQGGDRLLIAAAAAWTARARDVDIVARWGGEEFALVLPDFGTPDGLRRVVDRIREVTPMGQTVSAGIAIWDGDEDLTSLEGRADSALYGAKSAGRDRALLAGVDA